MFYHGYQFFISAPGLLHSRKKYIFMKTVISPPVLNEVFSNLEPLPAYIAQAGLNKIYFSSAAFIPGQGYEKLVSAAIISVLNLLR